MKFLLLGLLTLTGCGWGTSQIDGHGLRTFEIQMREDAAGEMLGGAHDHVRVPAKVRIDGENYEVEVNVAGASTLHETKKSLQLRFEGRGWNQYSEFRLSTSVRDHSMMRSFLAQEILEAAGVMTPKLEPVFVVLNQRVLGLYVGTEVVDASFFRRRNQPIHRIFEARSDANFDRTFFTRVSEVYQVSPNDHNLSRMLEIQQLLALDDREFEQKIFEQFDRASLIRYLIAGQVLDHWDGYNKNLYLGEVGQDRKLKPAAWDFDFTWTPQIRSDRYPWSDNVLFTRIASLPSVKAELEQGVRDLIGGTGSTSNLRGRMEVWREKIRSAYEADPYLGRAGLRLDQESENLMSDIGAWYQLIP